MEIFFRASNFYASESRLAVPGPLFSIGQRAEKKSDYYVRRHVNQRIERRVILPRIYRPETDEGDCILICTRKWVQELDGKLDFALRITVGLASLSVDRKADKERVCSPLRGGLRRLDRGLRGWV